MRKFFPAFIIIRLIIVLLVFAGFFLLGLPAKELFRVKPVNWYKFLARKKVAVPLAKKIQTAEAGSENKIENLAETSFPMDIEKLVLARIRGRSIKVKGKEWEGLFSDLAQASIGDSPDPYYYLSQNYFKVDANPLSSIHDQLNEWNSTIYALVTQDSGRVETLSISLEGPNDFRKYAPTWLAFPYQRYGYLLLILGLVIYIRQNWSFPDKSILRFSEKVRSQVPDLFAIIWIGSMITVASKICLENRFEPLSQNWFIIQSVFFLMAGFASFACFATAYYRSFSIDYSGSEVIVNEFFYQSRFRFNQIKEILSISYFPPAWMKAVLRVGLFWSRNPSERKLLQVRDQECGFSIVLENGTAIDISFCHLFGAADFFETCVRREVEVDDGVIHKAEDGNAEYEIAGISFSEQFGRIIQLVMLAVVLFNFYQAGPKADFKIYHDSLPEVAYSKEVEGKSKN